MKNENTQPITTTEGIGRGCPLSQLLFNIYAKMIVNEALQACSEGVQTSGRKFKITKFADNHTVLYVKNVCEAATCREEIWNKHQRGKYDK